MNQFRAWFLFIGGAGFLAFISMAFINSKWRQMVIHKDHAQAPLRKIFFEDMEMFEGGYPVRIRYKSGETLGRLRNAFRSTRTLKNRHVVGSKGLTHLLNRALDDYRARQMHGPDKPG